MYLEDFQTSGVTCNPVAAAQQAALCAMVYGKQTENIRSLLGTDGEIVFTHYTQGSWLPSLLIARSGPKRYFINIEGTVGALQGIGQGGPQNCGQYFPADGSGIASAGMFYLTAYLQLRIYLLPLIPVADPELRLYIAGHSMGGAVAQLAAFDYAREIAPLHVQLMTFGQPRCLTSGYNARQPAVYYRLKSSTDVVPEYPAAYPGLNLATLASPSTWRIVLPAWTHYGSLVELAANGVIAHDPVSVDPLPPDVAVGQFAEHGLGNYLGRIRAWVRRFYPG